MSKNKLKKMTKFSLSLGLLTCALFADVAIAQQPAAETGQSLEQAASDPTASLMSVQIQDVFVGAYYNLDDQSGNTILLRSALPFEAFGHNHIARVTLPITTDGPNGGGVGDMTLFDLVTFDASWGRWGAGAVMLVPIGEDGLSADKWAIGPAIGFTARQPGLLWGLFNQNLFSFAGDGPQDVNVSLLQPIVNYSLPNKWSIGSSDMTMTYDWERSAWTYLPLGVKLAKFTKIGKQPIQFAGSYEYNFADEYIGPEWSVNFTVKLLFPL
jgi:hypothetical protein